nr:hypothetical protein [Desulfosporosinus nitroreducens]
MYVPVHIGEADLSYILEHERTHIRRRDYLIKALAFLALSLALIIFMIAPNSSDEITFLWRDSSLDPRKHLEVMTQAYL